MISNSLHIAKKQSFYPGAKVTNSLNPFDPGTAKYRHKASIMAGPGKLVKVRKYKGEDGSRRITIEVEI